AHDRIAGPQPELPFDGPPEFAGVLVVDAERSTIGARIEAQGGADHHVDLSVVPGFRPAFVLLDVANAGDRQSALAQPCTVGRAQLRLPGGDGGMPGVGGGIARARDRGHQPGRCADAVAGPDTYDRLAGHTRSPNPTRTGPPFVAQPLRRLRTTSRR